MKAVPRSRNAACVVIHWSATPSPYGCGISDVGSASSASPARSVTRGASAKVNGRRTTGCRVIRSGSKQFDPLADCGLYVRRNFNRRVVSLMLLGLRDDRHRSWTELSAPCVGLLAYCVNSTAACRPHASTRNSRPVPRPVARAATRNSPSIPMLRVGPLAGRLAPRPPQRSMRNETSGCRPQASTRNSPSIPMLRVGPLAGRLAPLLPEVPELYREVSDALLDQRNGVLKLVSLRSRDTHGVTLDARLYFELAVLDELDYLFCQILLDADTDRYHLFDFVAADLLDV